MFSRLSNGKIIRYAILVLSITFLVIVSDSKAVQVTSQSLQGELDEKVYLPLVMHNYTVPSYQMPPLSQNPLLMRAIRSNGNVVDYFGNRSSDGVPISLESVSVLQEGEDIPTLITMENNRPKEIIVGDGSRFSITWINDTNIEISATTSNRKYQVTVPVDLDNPQNTSYPNYQVSPSFFEGEQCNIVAEIGNGSTDRELHRATLNSVASAEIVSIASRQCGQPYDADTLVRVRYQSDELGIIDYVARQSGPGLYQAEIPVYDPNEDTPIGDICTNVVNALGIACTGLSGLGPAGIIAVCGAFSVAIDVIAGGPTGEAVLIYAACQTMLCATTIYCETLGNGPFPGGPSLADRICEVVTQLELPSGTITLQPFFFIPEQGSSGTYVYGDRLNFPSTGPFSTLPVEVTPNLNLPQPSLSFYGHQIINEQTQVYYQLRVNNWYAYPKTMFDPAPNLPPCKSLDNASRTWLFIYDINDNYVYGYCGGPQIYWYFSSIFGFVLPQGVAPPSPVSVKLIDRACGIIYESNQVSIPHP